MKQITATSCSNARTRGPTIPGASIALRNTDGISSPYINTNKGPKQFLLSFILQKQNQYVVSWDLNVTQGVSAGPANTVATLTPPTLTFFLFSEAFLQWQNDCHQTESDFLDFFFSSLDLANHNLKISNLSKINKRRALML